MYTIVNTYPKLDEPQTAEAKTAAARAIHTQLTQYLRESEE